MSGLPRSSLLALCVLALLTGLAACGGSGDAASGGPVGPTTALSPTTSPGPTYRLVEVDGRARAIDCRGSGSPTVVLESGLGVYSGTWVGVMDALADAPFRVCRYDRPGLGESEVGERPRTTERFVDELRALLAQAGETGPYVLVGHSLGGLTVQLFAREHPDEVTGAVLVDAIHPELDARIEPLLTPAQITTRREELELNEEGIRFDDIIASEAQVQAAPPFPQIPLVVLAHGLPFPVTDPTWPAEEVEDLWSDLQIDLARLTTDADFVVAEASQHRIQETEPDLVAKVIRGVVTAAGT
jgi:pimeloyl-ACP methyl ester carboxylesterase